jgi:hypothetical protein
MDILISAAIVSLLSSVVLFQTTEARKKAEDAQMKVEAQQVSTAVALYKNDHNGRAPLVTSSGGTGEYGVMHSESDENSDYIPTMQQLVNLGYLSQVPTSANGGSYSYGVLEDEENALFLFNRNIPSSNSNSCDFLPPPGSPPMCYMTRGEPATCEFFPEVTQTLCDDQNGCYTVVVSEERTECTEEIPPQFICEVDMNSSLCDEDAFCSCI